MTPTAPTTIFGNIVNELMIATPTTPYASTMASVTPRKIWLCRGGDALITPRAVDPAFKAYACDLLGLDPNTILDLAPVAPPTQLLALALQADAPALRRWRVWLDEHPSADVLVFALDRPTARFLRDHSVRPHDYAGLPGDATVDAFYALNTKSSFRAVAERLGLRTVPGELCQGVGGLLTTVSRMLASFGGVILKLDRSSNGYGHETILRADTDQTGLHQRLVAYVETFAEQPRQYVVERLMPFTSVPSVEIGVTDAGPSLLYLCDQRCRNRGFTGMVTPPTSLSDAVEAELIRIGEVFGRHVWELGFRGVCDVDTGLTDDGALYVTETNFRRTGGTYLDTLVRRLVGDDYLGTHVWRADARPASDFGEFAKASRRLADAGLQFDRSAGEGVVLTADTAALDSKCRYLVVARDHARASAVEHGLEDLFGLD